MGSENAGNENGLNSIAIRDEAIKNNNIESLIHDHDLGMSLETCHVEDVSADESFDNGEGDKSASTFQAEVHACCSEQDARSHFTNNNQVSNVCELGDLKVESKFFIDDYNKNNKGSLLDTNTGMPGVATDEKSIISSTPKKHNGIPNSKDLENILKRNEESKKGKLPSNLAIMVGDLSGIEPFVLPSNLKDQECVKDDNEETQIRPSTLDIYDLDCTPLESPGLLLEDHVQESEIKSNFPLKSSSNEVKELKQHYEREMNKLRFENEKLLLMLRSPAHESTLTRFRYMEDTKTELENKCNHYESRNRQLTLEVDRLSRNCFELERQAKFLEADKTILQERSFKSDQEKRRSDGELSKIQELLSESISFRRTLEDQLLFLKRKEIDSHLKMLDNDMALKEMREELNTSRIDCSDKHDVIRSITAQKHDIQENLDEALEQISRLEEASTSRAKEKTLFHKLLEEYEVLYKQHHRIRGLYNEAIQQLDNDLNDDENGSPSKRSLKLKIPGRNISFRKKWSISGASPAIREQQGLFDDNVSLNEEKTIHSQYDLSPTSQFHSPRTKYMEHVNRHSTGSLLSWDTGLDQNNNNQRFSGGILRKSSSEEFHQNSHFDQYNLCKPKYNDGDTSHVSGDVQESRHGMSEERDWIVQNMDGITRFDVVFSSPRSSFEKPEHDISPQSSKAHEYEHDCDENDEKFNEISRLERNLTKLSFEKTEIESQLARLPSSSSGRARRANAERQELLEERLNEIDKLIANIKMKLKKHKVL